MDEFIRQLLDHLEPGDIIIDGGNSNYEDTRRRVSLVESKDLLYIGTGVSGGEEGARRGPSIMPGGSAEAWPQVRPLFQAVSAKVDGGEPCCDWVGDDGAGHFVKMVHNGIEYGDMQLICEAYHLMKAGLGMPADEISQVFARWNRGRLDSYLIRITRDILAVKDDDGGPLVEKGPGYRRSEGNRAVDRDLGVEHGSSPHPHRRGGAGAGPVGHQGGPGRSLPVIDRTQPGRRRDWDRLGRRLGESPLRLQDRVLRTGVPTDEGGGGPNTVGNLDFGGIALMWRGGCIIRSVFLGKIKEAFDRAAGSEEPASWIPTSRSRWRAHRSLGAGSFPGRSDGESRSRRHPAPWPSTTATGRPGFPPTSCSPNGTTSAPTPTSAWTAPAASSSTLAGRNRANWISHPINSLSVPLLPQ